jgi:hypothetical protein
MSVVGGCTSQLSAIGTKAPAAHSCPGLQTFPSIPDRGAMRIAHGVAGRKQPATAARTEHEPYPYANCPFQIQTTLTAFSAPKKPAIHCPIFRTPLSECGSTAATLSHGGSVRYGPETIFGPEMLSARRFCSRPRSPISLSGRLRCAPDWLHSAQCPGRFSSRHVP